MIQQIAQSPSVAIKPEITFFESAGRHNEDLESTADRIIKGASWKKQRIITLIPSADNVNAKVVLSWWNMIYPPNQPNVKALITGMEVGDAYSQAIDSIIANSELRNWEYILTIEHDNTPPQDGILRLLERMEAHPELDAISGLYFTKGEGGQAQIWGDVRDPLVNYRPQVPRSGELVECYGTGMGFCLWRMSMFRDERIKRPFFQTKASSEGVGTQDLAFWAEARKWGHRCAVDCAVRVGHMDLVSGMVW